MSNLTRREFIKAASVAALALAVPVDIFAADNCAVKTRYGTFNGFVDEHSVKTWLGIPYAQPPVGKLRWQAPQPLKPSNKSFDAKKFGASAMQEDDKLEAASQNLQSEDCLTLNIWTRGNGKNKPVMVFIPGGAFQSGGSSDPLYNGSNFAAANDVVIVTINYRLHVFGFVNFSAIDSAYEDSGYLGIKDQIAALTWIKENIAEFGGNPDNVTIFGESAGAISVMLLMVIPAAKGLFNKAIPQSANSYMHSTPENFQVAEMYMELGGAKNMRDMMKKSSAELEQLFEKIRAARAAETVMDYLPICDGKFIPRSPFKALKDGAARGIKMLTGTTADEWRYWFLLHGENFFEMFRDNPKKLSPVMMKYTASTPQEIYRAWLNGRPNTIENFEDFVNQLDWRVGQQLAAEYQSKFDDVYYYLFSQPSFDEKLRSCHAVDLPYTFNNPDSDLEPNPPQNLVRAVQASWAAFAATGNPDNEFIPHWEKYSAANRQTMELNSKGCVCHKNLNNQNLNALRYVYES